VSLRLRILLLIGAVNVAVLLLVVWIGRKSVEATEQVGPLAMQEALRYAHSLRPEGFERHYTSFLVSIGGSGGQGLVRHAPPELEADAARVGERLTRHYERGEALVEVTGTGLTVVEPRGGEWHAYHVAFNDRATAEAIRPLRTIYILLSAGTLLLIVGTYLVLRVLVLRPLEQLAAASRVVAEGGVTKPVPKPQGRSEVARLVDTFNRMAFEVHEYQQHLEERVMDALGRVTAAEKRLVVAQRLSATGTLAAGFAHEINNPLGGILNALRKLQAGHLSEEREGEYYALVLDGLDRIRTIVDRILHFTPSRKEPASIDAAEVCRRAVALAAHRGELRGVEIAVRADQELRVVGDAQELTQAVLNLVLNAIDAIPEGGGQVTVHCLREGPEAFLEVTDDGVGMDPVTVRRCVDFFFSTKPEGEGTGLGLAIVQHIVTDHGGTLDIQSEQGAGTTVRIRLPLEQA